MRPTVDDGLRAIREATELAKSIQIELDTEYFRLIAIVEAMPQNQSGAEKSSGWRGRSNRDMARRGHFIQRRP
jgi:hypothetical protein